MPKHIRAIIAGIGCAADIMATVEVVTGNVIKGALCVMGFTL